MAVVWPTQQGEPFMAKMCPLDACKAKSGLFGHDKMMIVMGIAGAVAQWSLCII
jgi:hypothetical protein